MKDLDLSVNLSGLELKTPLMLASIMEVDDKVVNRMSQYGVGAIVTKTITLEPRKPYPAPVVYHSECCSLNAVGLPNVGVKAFLLKLRKLKANSQVPIIVSIAGYTPDEFAYIAKLVEDGGADAVELNLSCPHAKGLGAELGSDPKMVYDVVRAVRESVSIPVFAKLTPNIDDILKIGKAAEDGGASGVTAINTVRGLLIDIETLRPVLGFEYGGVSGKAIHPIAVYAVWRLYNHLKIPIIGVGGVESYEDVIRFMLVGATAVQVGTAVLRYGIGIFQKLLNGVETYMLKHGFSSIKDIIGLYNRKHKVGEERE